VAVTTVPFPGSDSIKKSPPHLFEASFHKDSPRPIRLVVLVVTKGSVTVRII
jgi:hypothetical protein